MRARDHRNGLRVIGNATKVRRNKGQHGQPTGGGYRDMFSMTRSSARRHLVRIALTLTCASCVVVAFYSCFQSLRTRSAAAEYVRTWLGLKDGVDDLIMRSLHRESMWA